MTTRFDRRLFVLSSAAALARPLGSRRRAGPRRTLVLLQLTGGNDGLSMVVPHSDDAYARARPTTRIPAGAVLRLDERIGFAPTLRGLHALYQKGRVALCEGVGHPYRNRSHFRCMDIWHAAGPRALGARAGWIGRCIERSGESSPYAVVHIGLRPPFSLASASRPPLSITPALLLAGDRDQSSGQQVALELEEPAPDENATLATLRSGWHQAQAALLEVRATLERPGQVPYPPSGLGQDLRQAAALIHSELGVRVVSLELGGFDTHRDQPVRHEILMHKLDAALAAFCADLGRSESGREALVLVFSEFGRRVPENASRGTDHGAAGLVLVLGACVRGGRYGSPPSLTALEDGDLTFTTDFRSVYSDCIEHVFGLAPEQVLGARFPAVGLV